MDCIDGITHVISQYKQHESVLNPGVIYSIRNSDRLGSTSFCITPQGPSELPQRCGVRLSPIIWVGEWAGYNFVEIRPLRVHDYDCQNRKYALGWISLAERKDKKFILTNQNMVLHVHSNELSPELENLTSSYYILLNFRDVTKEKI